jgi:hypothetical protein
MTGALQPTQNPQTRLCCKSPPDVPASYMRESQPAWHHAERIVEAIRLYQKPSRPGDLELKAFPGSG